VHQDCSAAELSAGGGHVLVPEMAAHVVDDLGSGFDGAACGGGVEGVHGEDGAGLCFEDGFDGGEDAGLLLVGAEGRGVGAGGFAADVEDGCTFVEHLERLLEGSFGRVVGGVEEAAVGEGIGRDIEDAHDDGSLAEGDGTGAEVPVMMTAGDEGHVEILAVSCRTGPLRVGRSLRDTCTCRGRMISNGPPVGRNQRVPTKGRAEFQ